jgi:cell division protein ZapA (FtsZ GTPase activity inhibitor)
METVEIEVLGKIYRLRSDNPNEIRNYSEKLNAILDKLYTEYKIIDNKDLLILSAMRLVEENEQLLKKNEQLENKIDGLDRIVSTFTIEFSD